jgi:beta-xylosidase
MKSNACAGGITAWLVTTLFSAAAAHAQSPVLDVDFPDPFVLAAGDGLVAYATNVRVDGRINVPMSRSRDGMQWSVAIDAMPTVPPWAYAPDPSIWAPEAIEADGRYVLFFSARHATRMRPDGRTLCVGAAVSIAPEGPFVPQPEPLTCGGEHGVIDASPFRDGADLWLHYKTDGNCCGSPTLVLAQRLSADGLQLVGESTVLQGIAADNAWEGAVIEAPQMVRAEGGYWLFYAGNDYGGRRYATGYARCEGPAGPCVDAPENPILQSGADPNAPIGPGHPNVFQYDGRSWIAYHGWRDLSSRRNRYRALYIERLDWSSGSPRVVPR